MTPLSPRARTYRARVALLAARRASEPTAEEAPMHDPDYPALDTLEQAESDARAAELVRLYCTAVESLDALLVGVLRELGDEHPTADDEVEIARAHIRRGLAGLRRWMEVSDAGR